MSTGPKNLAVVLSGGGVRATVFHLGLFLRFALENKFEQIHTLSTVSGGSLSVALVFCANDLKWPTSREFIERVLPHAQHALTRRSLQGTAALLTFSRPWRLASSRGDIFAKALETEWGIRGALKQLDHQPNWLINSTCYETGANWRFSQRHIGDWRFGHNFTQSVSIASAVAASAAIPYMAGFVKLSINDEGWFKIDPSTDAPIEPIQAKAKEVRLWDGGVYENLGVEAVHKPQRGLVNEEVEFLVVSDASAYLKQDFGMATGIFTKSFPFLRPPRLFDIATEQTRALRSRIIMHAVMENRLKASIVRLGRSVAYIDKQANRRRQNSLETSFLNEEAVQSAARYPTNATRMRDEDYLRIMRHGFETSDATLTAYQPQHFSKSLLWNEALAVLNSEI